MFLFGPRKLNRDVIGKSDVGRVLKVFQRKKVDETNLNMFYESLDDGAIRDKYRTREVCDTFLQLLDIGDSSLLYHCVRILTRIGSEDVAARLIGVLETDEDMWVRAAAGEYLAKTGWASVVPALVKAIAADEWAVSSEIAMVPGHQRNTKATEAIADGISEVIDKSRCMCVEASGE